MKIDEIKWRSSILQCEKYKQNLNLSTFKQSSELIVASKECDCEIEFILKTKN